MVGKSINIISYYSIIDREPKFGVVSVTGIDKPSDLALFLCIALVPDEDLASAVGGVLVDLGNGVGRPVPGEPQACPASARGSG